MRMARPILRIFYRDLETTLRMAALVPCIITKTYTLRYYRGPGKAMRMAHFYRLLETAVRMASPVPCINTET